MVPICLIFSLAVIISAVHAAPVEPNQPPSSWSKEAIFGLLGFFAAILTILAMVLMASPSARKWCTREHAQTILHGERLQLTGVGCFTRKQKVAMRATWDEYVEYLRWQEMTGRRSS
ncbi:hypothetical protein HBI40_050830 [Parastagonospora nodorum]|nr:hypothetical protein HBI62_173310 [Parastagonospora nodorum]KAH6296338.1 hypothetical protein HBI40_050830 [Parastagonospora nodorum]KAH6519806.1 hypothetical protein HBI07_233810 [Parastagonospora nodorum]